MKDTIEPEAVTVNTSAIQIIETMHQNKLTGPQHLSIVPVKFGRYDDNS